jgi:hypothetical protein
MPQNPGTPFWASPRSAGPPGRCSTSPALCMPGHNRGLRHARPQQTVNLGTHISFDRNSRTVAESCNSRPAGPARRSSDASVLTALMSVVEPQQPGYLSHSDAVAAPVDRFPYRQPSSSVIVRSACPARRSASRTKAVRSPSAVSTATAKPSSRRSRSARSLRSIAWASNAERRAACLTDC